MSKKTAQKPVRDTHSFDYIEGQFDFIELYHRLQSYEQSRTVNPGLAAPHVTTIDRIKSTNEEETDFPREGNSKRRRPATWDDRNSKASQPRSLNWVKYITIGEFIGGGGFGDVFIGEWTQWSVKGRGIRDFMDVTALPRVAVKRFRVAPSSTFNKSKKKVSL